MDWGVRKVFFAGVIIGAAGLWWVGVLWRGRTADKAHFTAITERAAELKLAPEDERVWATHPDLAEVSARVESEHARLHQWYD